jgi:hypothetical protein
VFFQVRDGAIMSDTKLPRFSSEAHLPSTFEERGASVAFTTPGLAGTRIRADDRHGLTVLLKNFAGSTATYAVPVGSLFEVISTTVHDKALIEAIQAANARSPSAIRRETIRIMALGLAGPEGKDRANEIIEADNHFRADLEQIVLISTLKAVNADMSKFANIDFKNSQAIHALKKHLYELLSPLGMAPELIDTRLADLSDALSFIGFPHEGMYGRLRNVIQELRDFEKKMGYKAGATNAEFGMVFDFAAKTAKQNIAVSDPIIGAMDGLLTDLALPMKSWDAKFPVILKSADRLSWLLDGWESVLAFAANCESWDGETVWDNTEMLASMLPMVPRAEVATETEEQADTQVMGARVRIKALHNWKDGKPDPDMVKRMEAAKTAMRDNGPTTPKPKRALGASEVEWKLSNR